MNPYTNASEARRALIIRDEGIHLLPIPGKHPIKFVANESILSGFDDAAFEQAINTALTPGVDSVLIGPDAHKGYGCPVGSVVKSHSHIYPGPVGPDISCSMSFLQTNVPHEAVADKRIRRALIEAICARIPTGTGNRKVSKSKNIPSDHLESIPVYGASSIYILESLNVPHYWIKRLENINHGNYDSLERRMSHHKHSPDGDILLSKLGQLGSYGGGNHFGEAQRVEVIHGEHEIADHFGLKNGKIGFMSHCGSRGFGYRLAAGHFASLEKFFHQWGIPLPAGEKELVYAPIESQQAQDYILDMFLAANFAIVNHLVINARVLEAFQEVLPGTTGELIYHIAHNIGSEEGGDWVFRKGATRALPALHPLLRGTHYEATGHPILLPGNPISGSKIMVALQGAQESLFSINHGAGRAMGRREAKRNLAQADVDSEMNKSDVLSNCRFYPVDEAPRAYKDFGQVTDSIEKAGLATTVANLAAEFVIKDSDQSAEGSA